MLQELSASQLAAIAVLARRTEYTPNIQDILDELQNKYAIDLDQAGDYLELLSKLFQGVEIEANCIFLLQVIIEFHRCLKEYKQLSIWDLADLARQRAQLH